MNIHSGRHRFIWAFYITISASSNRKMSWEHWAKKTELKCRKVSRKSKQLEAQILSGPKRNFRLSWVNYDKPHRSHHSVTSFKNAALFDHVHFHIFDSVVLCRAKQSKDSFLHTKWERYSWCKREHYDWIPRVAFGVQSVLSSKD